MRFESIGRSKSKFFVSDGSGSFSTLQNLTTSRATSLTYFTSQNTTYMFVGQRESTSILFRWNGSNFLADNEPSTLPKDLAGGQVMRTPAVTAASHFRINNSEYLALGVDLADSLPGYILPSTKEEETRLSGPNAIADNPVSNRIYVGAYYSYAISVFERDANSRALIYLPDVYYAPNVTVDVRRAQGYPIRGITSMVFAADGSTLYVSSFFDGTVTVFNVDGVTGKLSRLQVRVGLFVRNDAAYDSEYVQNCDLVATRFHPLCV
jgi:DNA-binding beta-propeller fold protein YncE